MGNRLAFVLAYRWILGYSLCEMLLPILRLALAQLLHKESCVLEESVCLISG